MRQKDRLNSLIGLLLGLIFLILWIKIVNWSEFLQYFREFNLKYALLFSLFYILAYFIRSVRWKVILNPIYKMTIMESFKIFMSGLLINFIIPVRAGELAKSVILKKKEQVRISSSLPSIFIDKISDLFPIILILSLIPLISIKLNSYLYTILFLLLLIFLFFIGFLFFSVNHRDMAIRFLHSIMRIFPKKYQEKFEDFFTNFVDGMKIMNNRVKDNMIVYLLTLLAVMSEALYIFMIFRAFGSQTSYSKILFGYTLMNLTYILPTPPAQIGSNQIMWVLIFSFALGIDENLTSAAITFSHLLTSSIIFLFGGLSMLLLKIKFNELIIGNFEKTT